MLHEFAPPEELLVEEPVAGVALVDEELSEPLAGALPVVVASFFGEL